MEKFPWFGKDRDRQKLMSQVSEIATEEVDNLRSSNFTRIDGEGVMRIKKEFTWTEFVPKKNNLPQLSKSEVLEALGVDPNVKIEDAPERDDLEDRELKGIWSTTIPGLKYIQTKDIATQTTDGYFQVQEIRKPQEGKDYVIVEKEEILADWNKRMWEQEDADKKADKEITEDPANYSKDRNS